MKTNNAKDKIANTLMAILFVFLMTLLVNNIFGQDGKVTREVWTGISGTTISKIPLTTTPNSTGTLTSIQAPVNNADNYGQRIKGYIIPTTTGTYNLYISSDDYGELWLSTNNLAANKTKIASVSGYTSSLQWTKYTSQKSTPVSLTAGLYYYFEALMKEGTGGDNLAIGWTGPGISSITVIGASNISTTFTDSQAPTSPTTLSSASVTATSFTLSWTASTDNVGVASYEVFANGTSKGTTTSTSVSISSLTCATTYTTTVKAKDAAGNVSAASSALSVNTGACAGLTKLTGTAFGTTPTYQNGTSTFDKVFDGDINTYFDYANANGGYAGLDLASAYSIGQIKYYPRSTFTSRMTGGKFQGSNDNTTYTDIYTISTEPTLAWQTVDVSSSAYRYVRYLSPDGGYCNVAEVEFYTGGTVVSDTKAPSAPTSLASASVSTISFTLSWTASTDNVGVTSYDVYKNGTLYTNVTNTSASISGLSCNTAYSMTVKAKDAAGNVSAASSALSVTTSACSTPTPSSTTEYFGINVGFLTDWDPIIYTDMFKQISSMRTWQKPGTSTNANIDANGWPTEDAQIVVRHDGADKQQRSGKYFLSFTGQANISFGYTTVFTIQNKVYNSSTNTTTADLVASATFSNLQLIFTGTSGGVKNVKLMRPTANGSSQSYSTSTLFVPEMVNIMKKFNTLRFMDPTGTNSNTQVAWSSRTLPGNMQRGTMSWEHVIMLCNEVGADAYINIPHQADADYITKLAQVFRYGSDGVNPYTSVQTNPVYPPLNTNLKLYVEYSNEVWNTAPGFDQTQWNMNQAVVLVNANYSHPLNYDSYYSSSRPATSASWELCYRSEAWRGAEASKIFRTVFGNDQMMTRVRPVYCWQADYAGGQPWTAIKGFEFLTGYYQKNFGQAPNYFFWGGGGASYSNPSDDCSVLTIDNVWTTSTFDINTWRPVVGDKFMTSLFGMEYMSYEGGPAFGDNLGGSASCTIGDQALKDDRMINEVIEHHDKFSNWGGVMETYYCLNHDYRWGFIEDTDNPYVWKRLNAIDQIKARTSRAPITAGVLLPATIIAKDYNGTLGNTWTAGVAEVSMRTDGMAGYLCRTNATETYNVSFEYDYTAGTSAEIIVDGVSYGTINLPSSGWGTKVITTPVQVTLTPDKLHNIAIKRTGAADFNLWRVIVTVAAKNANALVDKNTTDYSVVVYPNTATDYITIALTNASDNDRTNITLSDLTGKVVYSNTMSQVKNLYLSTSFLSKGVYIININNGAKNYNQKLIIK